MKGLYTHTHTHTHTLVLVVDVGLSLPSPAHAVTAAAWPEQPLEAVDATCEVGKGGLGGGAALKRSYLSLSALLLSSSS